MRREREAESMYRLARAAARRVGVCAALVVGLAACSSDADQAVEPGPAAAVPDLTTTEGPLTPQPATGAPERATPVHGSTPDPSALPPPATTPSAPSTDQQDRPPAGEPPAGPPTAPTPDAPPPGVRGGDEPPIEYVGPRLAIRNVDFANGFPHVGLDGETVFPQAGVSESGSFEDGDYQYFAVTDVDYGDLDGDGIEEAAVSTVLNGGGTGFFEQVVIYRLDGDEVVEVGATAVGDRAFGGHSEVAVRDGVLLVEVFGTDGGACCPEWVETMRYELVAGQVVALDPSERRPWVGTQEPVTMVVGESIATVLRVNPGAALSVVADPGTSVSVWAGDPDPNWRIQAGDGDLRRRLEFGSLLHVPDSGQVELTFEQWPGAGSAVTVEVAFGDEPLVSPIRVANGVSLADDPSARVIASGLPVMMTPDGSALIVADRSRSGGLGCEGESLVDLWRQPLDGSDREPLGVSNIGAGTGLRRTDSYLVVMQACDGVLLWPEVWELGPDGTAGSKRVVEAAGDRVLGQWSVNDDGTFWVRVEEDGRQVDRRFDAATGEVLESIEDPDPVTSHRTGWVWSEPNQAWHFALDDEVFVTRALDRTDVLRSNRTVVDRSRGLIYVGLWSNVDGHRTVALSLDGDAVELPGVSIGATRRLDAADGRVVASFDNGTRLAWRSATLDGSGLLAIEDLTSTRHEIMLATPHPSFAVGDGVAIVQGNSSPSGRPGLVGLTWDDTGFLDVVETSLGLVNGYWFREPRQLRDGRFEAGLGGAGEATVRFDDIEVSLEGIPTGSGGRSLRLADRSWTFDVEVPTGWTAAASPAGLELRHGTGAAIDLFDDGPIGDRGNPDSGWGAQPTVVATFQGRPFDQVNDERDGWYLTGPERRDGESGEVRTLIADGVERRFRAVAWLPETASGDLGDEVVAMFGSIRLSDKF